MSNHFKGPDKPLGVRTTRDKDRAACKENDSLNADSFADGCAHRDRQTAAYLRRRAQRTHAAGQRDAARELLRAADAITREEHVP